MSRRRLPLGLLAPISLLLLVVALGALQYRWVGQVSEGEREQLKQSLDRRSREFAEEFDREIGRAYQLFRLPSGFTPDAPDRFTRQYEEWRSSARFPDMVKAAYFTVQEGSTFMLHRYLPDSRTFEPIEWPDSLQPVKARLQIATPRPVAGSGGGGNSGFMIATLPVLPEIPALVIGDAPSMATSGASLNALHMPGVTTSFTVDVRVPQRYTIVELDRDFMNATMLPTLAERHFPEIGADRVRLAVVDGASNVMYARGLTANQTLTTAKADASAGFFGIRIETVRGVIQPLVTMRGNQAAQTFTWSTRVPGPTDKPTIALPAGANAIVLTKPGADVKTDVNDRMSMVIEEHSATMAGAAARLPSRAGWTLLLQHSAGSLDAAVDRVRHRNLWLSFGILSVLAASAGLVLVNARRSEKLAAQQMDFVATVSHELRTPVAVIRSAAQNLAAGVVHDPEQAKRYGHLIEDEGRRLTDMVEQVLEYAGLADGRRLPSSRPVDTAQLARDVVASSESLPEAGGVTIETTADDRVPAVMADEDAIRRALLNLVGNALKYGADGGWIGVTVARGTGRDEGHALISVADRGRGIPAEDLSQIFQPFYRGAYARERQIHGSGLGLSLVKRIAEAHGGRVTVKSAPGQGSIFTLSLPFAAEATTGTAARTTQSAPAARPAEGHSA